MELYSALWLDILSCTINTSLSMVAVPVALDPFNLGLRTPRLTHRCPIRLHYDVPPLKAVVGENGAAIAAKDSWQDMLVIPSLVGHPLASFEKINTNYAAYKFVLGCKRSHDLVGALNRREQLIKRRSALNVAEVARVLQLPELIEVSPKGFGNGGFRLSHKFRSVVPGTYFMKIYVTTLCFSWRW